VHPEFAAAGEAAEGIEDEVGDGRICAEIQRSAEPSTHNTAQATGTSQGNAIQASERATLAA